MPTHIDKTEMSVPKILKKEKVVLQKTSSKCRFESLDGTIGSLYGICANFIDCTQGPQRHFEFGGAKKISGAAIYIKFEFFKNKISTY